MTDRVNIEELAHDLRQTELEKQYSYAEDAAIARLNAAHFDSDSIRECLNQDADWWNTLCDMLAHDPCSAGVKLREALYRQLVKEELPSE